jgi:hypothetical protein
MRTILSIHRNKMTDKGINITTNTPTVNISLWSHIPHSFLDKFGSSRWQRYLQEVIFSIQNFARFLVLNHHDIDTISNESNMVRSNQQQNFNRPWPSIQNGFKDQVTFESTNGWLTPRCILRSLVPALSSASLAGNNFLLALASTNGVPVMTIGVPCAIKNMKTMIMSTTVHTCYGSNGGLTCFVLYKTNLAVFWTLIYLLLFVYWLNLFLCRQPCGFYRTFSGRVDHPYTRLITQQGLIGWDHLIRGKISKEWGVRQYAYARRYNLLDKSKQWQTALVRFLAHSSQRLWQICNGCRHGIDAATQAQVAQEQTHREVCCLYHLQGVVLIQDRHLFRDTVKLHLTESPAQLRMWLTHNAKLIAHSAKLATAQAALRIRQLKAIFPPQRTIRSIINVAGPITTRRCQTTRLNSYFATTGVNKSTTGRNHRPSKRKQYTTPSMAT